jgi:hypothetical protein
MTIDTFGMKVAAVTSYTSRISSGSRGGTAEQAGAAVNQPTASDAARIIQDHLSGGTDPPQYSVDYLSGLGVMTVRSASDGQVIFQIPGPTAIHLAQLLKEGAPVESFGLLDQTI